MTDRYEIIEDFWKQLDVSPVVMIGLAGTDLHSEPMTALFDSSIPNKLHFFVRKDNRLCAGLERGNLRAVVQFASKGHEIFGCLHGTLRKSDDVDRIQHFWSGRVAAWFDEGRTDPMLQMLELDLEEAELWRAHLPVQGRLKLAFGGKIDRKQAEQQHVRVQM